MSCARRCCPEEEEEEGSFKARNRRKKVEDETMGEVRGATAERKRAKSRIVAVVERGRRRLSRKSVTLRNKGQLRFRPVFFGRFKRKRRFASSAAAAAAAI